MSKRDVMATGLTMAADAWVHRGVSSEQTLARIREITTDPELLARAAAYWRDHPELAALFVEAGAPPELVAKYVPPPPKRRFDLRAMADGIQHGSPPKTARQDGRDGPNGTGPV